MASHFWLPPPLKSFSLIKSKFTNVKNFQQLLKPIIIAHKLLFRPLLRGEELYTQMGFFVQTILADRYIHRRELRLVSLGSLSSVEYKIKKIFSIFVIYRELSRYKF